jgi:transcriptional regulator
MYIPKHFAVEDHAQLEDFIRTYGFATLVTQGAHGLMATHLPLVLGARDDGSAALIGHVARANPHWQDLESGVEALAIFHGPHAYISPSWYEAHPSVPTWNYAVVHVYGRARLLDAGATLGLLERLTDQYEAGRDKPWCVESLPHGYTEKMVAAIVGFEIAIERIEGKFKLSQNRSAADQEGVINALKRGTVAEQDTARLMEHTADRPKSR